MNLEHLAVSESKEMLKKKKKTNKYHDDGSIGDT